MSHTLVPVLALLTALTSLAASLAHADDPSSTVRCAPVKMCFCTKNSMQPQIAQTVANLRAALTQARQTDKATIYLSTPISSRGGSQFDVNVSIANQTRERLKERFGDDAVFILNPASVDLNPVDGERATQGDYGFLWATVIGGATGFAEDFDAIYFVGPDDYADYFALDGHKDLVKVADAFDRLLKENQRFAGDVEKGKLTRATFVHYYGLRGSSALSTGALDEWNIAQLANAKRRGETDKFGIGGQLALLMGGGSAEIADYADAAPRGNESLTCTDK